MASYVLNEVDGPPKRMVGVGNFLDPHTLFRCEKSHNTLRLTDSGVSYFSGGGWSGSESRSGLSLNPLNDGV